CGGDRDRGKRPLMTQAALEGSDIAVLTSDNPRTEDPAQIFADMENGIDFLGKSYHEIHDRREAIKFAVKHAQAGDIVVIAGKGHENYQEIDGVRHWFDDVVEVQAAIDAQHHSAETAYPASEDSDMHTPTTSTVPLAPWTAEQLEQATQGNWRNNKKTADAIKRILTDSRDAEQGDAFLALQGERFDAHDFVAQVAASGCQIAIVSRPLDIDICQLVVDDTRLALGRLGAYRRQQNPQLKVIALTGSSGKTTTKE